MTDKCYMLDQGCPVHGYIHGKEAEELREGIENLLERAALKNKSAYLRREIRNFLDDVDARDSAGWGEASGRPKSDVEPRHAHVEGVCVPVCGEEDNYLEFFPRTNEDLSGGITNILRKANAEPTEWSIVAAFESSKPPRWGPVVDKYRTETGRSYPPLYRVRIHVVVEDVGAEEAEKLWKQADLSSQTQGDEA